MITGSCTVYLMKRLSECLNEIVYIIIAVVKEPVYEQRPSSVIDAADPAQSAFRLAKTIAKGLGVASPTR